MAAPTRIWTVEEVRALPDERVRYEVVDGELLVTPAPSWSHQRAVRILAELLQAYASAHAIGAVIFAPADVQIGPRTLVQPDLFVVPLVGRREPDHWAEVQRMLLAVEVLSPSTSRADRVVKRALYQRLGVPEYWIVDRDARLVERWKPEDERPEIVTGTLEWRPDPDVEALRIELDGFYARIIGA